MKIALVPVAMFALTAAAGSSAPPQQKQLPKKAPAKYDTPAQREARLVELAQWCIANSSQESPASSRKEYALKVLDILERWAPHRITYAMFQELSTEDQNGNYLPDAWLKFGALPKELSRTTIGDAEIVVWQWANADGSNVIGTYKNGHLVNKAQSGLR